MVKETEARAIVDRKLEENFQDFWYKILNFNVLRLNKICVELGGPKEATVCQVIAWHHYLNSISEATNNKGTSAFTDTLNLWDDFNPQEHSNSKPLSILLISSLASIPFETTRRILKKLEKKKWIFLSKKNGVILNTDGELNKKIVLSIHPFEKNLLKDFLVSFMMAGES
jgi:hypothetical protein